MLVRFHSKWQADRQLFGSCRVDAIKALMGNTNGGGLPELILPEDNAEGSTNLVSIWSRALRNFSL